MLLCPSCDLCGLGDVLSLSLLPTPLSSRISRKLMSVLFLLLAFHVFWAKDSRAASWLVINLLIPALGDSTTEGPRAASPVSQTLKYIGLTSQTHSDLSFSTHHKFIPQGSTRHSLSSLLCCSLQGWPASQGLASSMLPFLRGSWHFLPPGMK